MEGDSQALARAASATIVFGKDIITMLIRQGSSNTPKTKELFAEAARNLASAAQPLPQLKPFVLNLVKATKVVQHLRFAVFVVSALTFSCPGAS